MQFEVQSGYATKFSTEHDGSIEIGLALSHRGLCASPGDASLKEGPPHACPVASAAGWVGAAGDGGAPLPPARHSEGKLSHIQVESVANKRPEPLVEAPLREGEIRTRQFKGKIYRGGPKVGPT